MTDKVEVEVGGQSKFEVAHRIAINILKYENKTPPTRADYLNTVAQAIEALHGVRTK